MRKFLKALALAALSLVLSIPADAAIKVGRGTGVVLATDTVTTTIDVAVTDSAGSNFTPTAGTYFVLVNWSGRTEATDTVGGANINMGMGMGVSSTSRRGVSGFVEDAAATSITSRSGYDDAVLKVLDNADTAVGALDLVGEITNGIRFIVDDQFPADVRFQVLVIDGLTDVGLFNILEPAATGQTTHTGAGVDSAELFIFMSANFITIPIVGTSMALQFGAAHADGQFVVSVTSEDAQIGTSDTYNYGTDLECIARQSPVNGALAARASFVGTAADGLTLDWLERSSTDVVFFAAALKGIEATVQNALTLTNTTSDIVVTGLGNTALGGIVVSAAEAENTQDTPGNGHHWSFGTFVSTTNRGAHASWDQDATVTESATCVEYDSVYCNISTTDTVQGLMNVQSLDAVGATFRMTDADPAQKWFGAVLLATPVVGGAANTQFFRRRLGP